MPTNFRNIENLILNAIDKDSVYSVYFSESNNNFLTSDCDILIIHKSDFDYKILIDKIHKFTNDFLDSDVYIRWSTTGFFKKVNEGNKTKKPIILDVLLIFNCGNKINQIGFENHILENILIKSQLIWGVPFNIQTAYSNDSNYITTYRHYFQNNLSNLIELQTYAFKPFEVYLNSLKIFFLALNKYYCIDNNLFNTIIDFDRIKIINSLKETKPELTNELEFVQKSLHADYSNIDMVIAIKMLRTSIKLTTILFKLTIKTEYEFNHKHINS